jgi:DNA-binding transcriptional LysR family regulator
MVHKQTAVSRPVATVDWSDLPVLLAVERHGTLRAAAKALRVSHSTVLRRLAAVEASLGARLFDRDPAGRYEPTAAGQDAFDTARQLEELVQVMERRIQGRDLELRGPLHVTMPAAFMPVFATDLARFCDTYPNIELSVAAGLGMADLAYREADIALRITPAPSPDLVGRRLATVAVGVYGSTDYLAGHPARTPLDKHVFIGWHASMAHTVFARWIATHVPRARIRCRLAQDWQAKEAIDAGWGLALAPCALGDSQPHWRRVRLARDLATPLWILTHRDLRATARMRTCRDFLAEAVAAKRDLIEGRKAI